MSENDWDIHIRLNLTKSPRGGGLRVPGGPGPPEWGSVPGPDRGLKIGLSWLLASSVLQVPWRAWGAQGLLAMPPPPDGGQPCLQFQPDPDPGGQRQAVLPLMHLPRQVERLAREADRLQVEVKPAILWCGPADIAGVGRGQTVGIHLWAALEGAADATTGKLMSKMARVAPLGPHLESPNGGAMIRGSVSSALA